MFKISVNLAWDAPTCLFMLSSVQDRMISSSFTKPSMTVCWSPTSRPSFSACFLNATRMWPRGNWQSPSQTGRGKRLLLTNNRQRYKQLRHLFLTQARVQSKEGGLGWRQHQSGGVPEGTRRPGPAQTWWKDPHHHNRGRSAQVFE